MQPALSQEEANGEDAYFFVSLLDQIGLLNYLLEELDFEGKVFLDAGTGAGGTTSDLARLLVDAGGTGCLVSVDIDSDAFSIVKEKLGILSAPIHFVNADLNCSPFRDRVFAAVVCTAALCALNSKPLKVLKGLVEFHRVIRKDGVLRISEEFPLPKPMRCEERIQVKRWQLYKPMTDLAEGEHWTEIHPEELAFACRVAGFDSIEWKCFEGVPLGQAVMDEWLKVRRILGQSPQ